MPDCSIQLIAHTLPNMRKWFHPRTFRYTRHGTMQYAVKSYLGHVTRVAGAAEHLVHLRQLNALVVLKTENVQ